MMVVAGLGYRGGRSRTGTMVALLYVGSWSDAGAAVTVFRGLVCSGARSRPLESSARREGSLAQPAAGCFLS
jgi:hypothetical protein